MLKAGFGRSDITPELGVRLGGYGVKERPAEQINDHLHSTAIVLEQKDLKTVLLNLDWICIEEELVARIRNAVNERTGILENQISVCTTHSHSVPNTLNFWGWGECEYEYVDSVIPTIVDSVELALNNLQEVEVGFATTESLVGVNRRGVDEEGNVNFDSNPHGSFDPTMTVAHFKNKATGNNVGIIVHYGAHGTAMGCNRIVSRDWCGVMKDRIELQFNAPVFFINGAIGDVGPRTNYYTGNNSLCAGAGDGIESVREVGYRAATDAIRALLSIKEWRYDLKLTVHLEDINIAYAPLTSLEEAEKELVKWESQKNEWGPPMCEYKHNQAVIAAHKEPLKNGRNFPQVITAIGPMAIVPMPGEMFSGISLRIRKGSPFAYTCCASVTNGSLSYLPDREARHRGGYETWVGRAVGAYLLADNIDDVLVEQNLKLLKKISNCSKK